MCVCVGVCTSFRVNGTWISFKFLSGFTVSIDPPSLAKGVRTSLNQSRISQKIITLVTIVVTTQSTGPARPLWTQLWRQTEFKIVFFPIFSYRGYWKETSLRYTTSSTFKSTRPRPSQSRRKSSPNFTRTEDWTDLWIYKRPVKWHT